MRFLNFLFNVFDMFNVLTFFLHCWHFWNVFFLNFYNFICSNIVFVVLHLWSFWYVWLCFGILNMFDMFGICHVFLCCSFDVVQVFFLNTSCVVFVHFWFFKIFNIFFVFDFCFEFLIFVYLFCIILKHVFKRSLHLLPFFNALSFLCFFKNHFLHLWHFKHFFDCSSSVWHL